MTQSSNNEAAPWTAETRRIVIASGKLRDQPALWVQYVVTEVTKNRFHLKRLVLRKSDGEPEEDFLKEVTHYALAQHAADRDLLELLGFRIRWNKDE